MSPLIAFFICSIALAAESYALKGKSSKIAILMDSIIETAISQSLQNVRRDIMLVKRKSDSKNVQGEIVLEENVGFIGNSSQLLRWLCQTIERAPSFLLVITDCPLAQNFYLMIEALGIPTLEIKTGIKSSCRSSMLTSTCAGTKLDERSSKYLDVTYQNYLGKYFKELRWSTLIVLYDDTIDLNMLQKMIEKLENRMVSVAIQKLPGGANGLEQQSNVASEIVDNMIQRFYCTDQFGKRPDKTVVVFAIFAAREMVVNLALYVFPKFTAFRSISFHIIDTGWKENLANVLPSENWVWITKNQAPNLRLNPLPSEITQAFEERLKWGLKTLANAIMKETDKKDPIPMSCIESERFYSRNQTTDFLRRMHRHISDSLGHRRRILNELNNDFVLDLDMIVSKSETEDENIGEIQSCVQNNAGKWNCGVSKDTLKTLETELLDDPFVSNLCIDGIAERKNDTIHTTASTLKKWNRSMLRVVTIQDPPFVMTRMVEGETKFYGFSIDLLDTLAKQLDMKYEIYEVEDKKYGFYINGSWNGIVRDLLDGKADIAIAAMTITHMREQYIDFTVRYMDYSVGVLMKKTTKYLTFFAFLHPFEDRVWIAIIAAWFGVSTLVYILNKASSLPQSGSRSRVTGLRESFWSAYSTLVQQGSCSSGPRFLSLSSQLVTAAWWFTILIIASSYTAKLAAQLTWARMQPRVLSIPELVKQSEVEYGTVKDSPLFDLVTIKGSDPHSGDAVWKSMSNMISYGTNSVDAAEDGVEKVRSSNGKYAFLWDIANIEYVVKNDASCSLSIARDFVFEKGYGIAVRQGSTIKESLNLGILELQDTGKIYDMKERWWGKSIYANDAATHNADDRLDFTYFCGVFGILISGMILGSMVALCEMLKKRNSITKRPKNGEEDTSTDADKMSHLPNITCGRRADGSFEIIMSGVSIERNLASQQMP